jgi:hypothetical protein
MAFSKQGVGVKGRSGRKPVAVEHAKAHAIAQAWDLVSKDIKKFPANIIALPIALKDMQSKVDVTSKNRALGVYDEMTTEDLEKLANFS